MSRGRGLTVAMASLPVRRGGSGGRCREVPLVPGGGWRAGAGSGAGSGPEGVWGGLLSPIGVEGPALCPGGGVEAPSVSPMGVSGEVAGLL